MAGAHARREQKPLGIVGGHEIDYQIDVSVTDSISVNYHDLAALLEAPSEEYLVNKVANIIRDAVVEAVQSITNRHETNVRILGINTTDKRNRW